MSARSDRPLFDDEPRNYDAVLIVSFGGPEGPDDVLPFLDNVLRGLPIKPETKARIAARYDAFGGVSPINTRTREFIAALQSELDSRGPALPIYWGNRNWHPLLPEAFEQMARDGIERAIAFVTSTFSSYSGCRKYREDLHAASGGVAGAPTVDKLRLGFNHPGFIEACCDRVTEALEQLPEARRINAPILFTAHSLPQSMARRATYEVQLTECGEVIGDALEHQRWHLAYQSNNASYGGEPWLGPDVGDALDDLAREGVEDVVVAPIGFVCDHMEVVLDLDVEARQRADAAGINMIRAATVGDHPAFVAMVRELIVERMSKSPTRRSLGSLGPSHDLCPADCCPSGRPGPAKPALCGADAPREATVDAPQ
ncbi:ferrochelatase [Candidatus Rariloculus sp.]|uniref:ferrochelatase n=1 Tax=Candidatus Rariloculus sp. TaxID=3101265 RepID=UPI003D0A7F28